MSWTKDVRLTTRLIGSFAVASGITVILGFFVIGRLDSVHRATQSLESEVLPTSRMVSAIKTEIANFRLAELQHIVAETPNQRQWYETRMESASRALKADREVYERLPRSARDRAIYQEFGLSWSAFEVEHATVFVYSGRGDRRAALLASQGTSQLTFDQSQAKIQELLDQTIIAGVKAAAQNNQSFTSLRQVILLCLLIAVPSGLLMVYPLRRAIIIPLNRAVLMLEAVADGDLTAEIEIEGGNEVGRMGVALNKAVAAQRAALAGVRSAEEERRRQEQASADRERRQAYELESKVDSILAVVNAAAAGDLSHEITVTGNDTVGRLSVALAAFFRDLRSSLSKIAQTAQSLAYSSEVLSTVSTRMSSEAAETSLQAGVVSAASEQVSQNVQTVAAGAQEMSSSIREIARNAADAARVANRAVQVAEATNHTVGRLGISSAEIGAVIKVITSIAQQTNLLALNATIEAARAG
ncbi:MAG: MCP four helix bundle domain-containing protein, partial [Gemmatimonadota bacterium]